MIFGVYHSEFITCLEGDGIGEIQYILLRMISNYGKTTEAKISITNYKGTGGETKELINCIFVLKNPFSRLIDHPKTDLVRMFGRMLWELRGSMSAKEISSYDPNAFSFSYHGQILSGYGARISGQIKEVVSLLKDDL